MNFLITGHAYDTRSTINGSWSRWINIWQSLELSKLDRDRCWLISDKIFQMTKGNIVIHQCKVISTGWTVSLSKLNGDWCWLVGNEVL